MLLLIEKLKSIIDYRLCCYNVLIYLLLCMDSFDEASISFM